jgi:hypothetical protein
MFKGHQNLCRGDAMQRPVAPIAAGRVLGCIPLDFVSVTFPVSELLYRLLMLRLPKCQVLPVGLLDFLAGRSPTSPRPTATESMIGGMRRAVLMAMEARGLINFPEQRMVDFPKHLVSLF